MSRCKEAKLTKWVSMSQFTTPRSAVKVGLDKSRVLIQMTSSDACTQRLTSNEIVDLSGRGASNSVSNTNTGHSHLVDGAVNGEEVNEVGSERVFAGEANLETLGFDEFNDFNSSLSTRQYFWAPISAAGF